MCEQKLSVFSADYWRAARRELNNPRVLAFSGLVCAMAIVLESLPIYLLGPSLKIYFSFLAVSLGCMCYGPVVGMMAGAIIDTVGFLLAGSRIFPATSLRLCCRDCSTALCCTAKNRRCRALL